MDLGGMSFGEEERVVCVCVWRRGRKQGSEKRDDGVCVCTMYSAGNDGLYNLIFYGARRERESLRLDSIILARVKKLSMDVYIDRVCCVWFVVCSLYTVRRFFP
mmetsp:Transcript_3098/g.6872  ORF Transcript_3098/g.6872 Transcript_3098/m.6872 type:complete len:104 (+) Transcript_3098:82-393(+)